MGYVTKISTFCRTVKNHAIKMFELNIPLRCHKLLTRLKNDIFFLGDISLVKEVKS